MALQIRRGSTADRLTYTPEMGELIFDTTTKTLYVGDGATTGGIASTSLTYEDVQDYAAELLVNGSHSGISFTYNDNLGTIDAVVSGGGSGGNFELRVTGDDSTIRTINSGETLQISGTGGITTSSNVEGKITISPPSSYTNLAVDNLEARILSHPASSTLLVTSPAKFTTNVQADHNFAVGQVLEVGKSTLGETGSADASIELVKTTYEAGLHFVTFRQYCNDTFGGAVQVVKSRGDFLTPAAVTTGDDVGSYAFSAYDGSNFIGVGAINLEVTGPVTAESIPCSMRFIMHNGVSRATRAEITSTTAGNTTFKVNNLGGYTRAFIGFNDIPRLPSFATDGAANTAVGAGLANGMMYYNSTTHKFMGYANGAWVALN